MTIPTARTGAAALLLASACSGTPDPIGAQSEAITSGSPASDAAVVALVERRTSSGGPPPAVQCSGTVIAERLVLTAAHCLDRQARGVLEVFFGTKNDAPDGDYATIVSHRVHPAYDRQFDDNDVALVWLEDAAPVVPATLISDALDASAIGRRARLVGFGRSVTGDDGRAGEKLAGDVLLSELTENTLRYAPAPGMSCNGDSGGPLFVDAGQGEMLAGVISSGDRDCNQFGVAARVDVKLEEFVEPALATGPLTTTSVDFEGLCRATCANDGECPSDLVCRGDVDGVTRCSLPDLPAGTFESSCESDSKCSEGPCVPFGATGRCFRPCADETSGARLEAGGCSVHARPRASAFAREALLVLLASLGVVLGSRRRGRAGCWRTTTFAEGARERNSFTNETSARGALISERSFANRSHVPKLSARCPEVPTMAVDRRQAAAHPVHRRTRS